MTSSNGEDAVQFFNEVRSGSTRQNQVRADFAHAADAPAHPLEDRGQQNEEEDKENQPTPFAMRTIVLLHRCHGVPPKINQEDNGSYLSCTHRSFYFKSIFS